MTSEVIFPAKPRPTKSTAGTSLFIIPPERLHNASETTWTAL